MNLVLILGLINVQCVIKIKSSKVLEKSFQESDCKFLEEKQHSIESSENGVQDPFFVNSISDRVFKCGILPAFLINNIKSNAKFFIKWSFKTPKTVRLEFRLDSIEELASLSYYFSIRKFNGNEFYSQVTQLHQPPEDMANTSVNKQTLLLNIHTISLEYHEKYDVLKNAFVVCTIIINVKFAIAFNLPFMCVDVYFDEFFYEKDKVSKSILIALRLT